VSEKNKTEKVWWTGLTAEDMKNIDKKKSQKSKKREPWSDIYADVDRSPKKYKKSKRK
jgi:hypothetical protein